MAHAHRPGSENSVAEMVGRHISASPRDTLGATPTRRPAHERTDGVRVALSGAFPYLAAGDVVELEIDRLGRRRQVVKVG